MNESRDISVVYSEKALRMIALLVGGGFVGVVVFSLQATSSSQFASIVSVGILLGGASLLIGGLLGFLFGIPRTLQSDRTNEPPSGKESNQNIEGEQQIGYQVNTNLEQISDWLTKILVGVGLTQLSSIPEGLKEFSVNISPGLGGFKSSATFGMAMPVFFIICGFLFGYLWTRLYLPTALKQADIGLLVKQVKEFQSQAETDLNARTLTERQLSLGLDPVPQENLNEAIRKASKEAKISIFYQAQNTRSLNWEKEETKPLMERTIPIFKALIEADTEGIYHRNHGQLAYALKDKSVSDYLGALEELNKAIRIRDQQGEGEEYLAYEFNRAYCRIMTDKSFQDDKPSDLRSKEGILKDVEKAAEDFYFADIMAQDPVFQKWFGLNKIKPADIGIE
jgi:hypothetical protein